MNWPTVFPDNATTATLLRLVVVAESTIQQRPSCVAVLKCHFFAISPISRDFHQPSTRLSGKGGKGERRIGAVQLWSTALNMDNLAGGHGHLAVLLRGLETDTRYSTCRFVHTGSGEFHQRGRVHTQACPPVGTTCTPHCSVLDFGILVDIFPGPAAGAKVS